jgi:hypothetical protein
VTSVVCGDRRHRRDMDVNSKNGKCALLSTADDNSTTTCQCNPRDRTNCDDSGIIVEDHRQQLRQHSPSRTEFRRGEAAADEQTDAASASPAAGDRLDVITSSERRRSSRRHFSSTHHWYRHRRRASNERRAMERVAEWIDRNCGSCHDDQPTVHGATSLMLRMPEGGKLTLILDSRPNTGCRRSRHYASCCRQMTVDIEESGTCAASRQSFVVELVGLKQ